MSGKLLNNIKPDIEQQTEDDVEKIFEIFDKENEKRQENEIRDIVRVKRGEIEIKKPECYELIYPNLL